MSPLLGAVEFDLGGRIYRIQCNQAGRLQTLLYSDALQDFEHVHNADHTDAALIGFRLFSAKDQRLDPHKAKADA